MSTIVNTSTYTTYTYVLCNRWLKLHNVVIQAENGKTPRQTSTLLLAPEALCEAVLFSFPM